MRKCKELTQKDFKEMAEAKKKADEKLIGIAKGLAFGEYVGEIK